MAKGFSEEEKAAMKERAKELKSKNGESAVLEKIEKMPEHDRTIAKKLHELMKANAPELSSKTWYGMPAYAIDDKIVCFFQDANKFKARYATLGFSDKANLDEGDMWPTSFAIREWTPEVEKKIIALVKKAIHLT